MWAFLVLTLALSVRASDSTNDTAAEEELVIARGKLLVSADRNMDNMDDCQIFISCHDHNIFCVFTSGKGHCTCNGDIYIWIIYEESQLR